MKDSLFNNYHNVFELMLLNILRAPLDLLDSNALNLLSKLGSIFSGALSILHFWTSFKLQNLSSLEDAYYFYQRTQKLYFTNYLDPSKYSNDSLNSYTNKP